MLEVVTFPIERVCVQKIEYPVEVNCREEILKIEKEI